MKVVVVMITFNGDKYIDKQLESIFNQKYPAHRILIFDDASTDSTVSRIRNHQQNNEVELFINDKNIGIIRNIKNALNHINFDEYVALADQDDIWFPNKLEAMVTKMSSCEDKRLPCVVYSDLTVIDENDRLISTSFLEISKANKFEHNLETMLLVNVITGCATLLNPVMLSYKNTIPEDVSTVLHDEWFGLIAFYFGKAIKIDPPLLAHRKHKTSVTFSIAPQKSTLTQKIKRNIFEFILNKSYLYDRFTTVRAFNIQFSDKFNALQKGIIKGFLDLEEKNNLKKRMYVWRCFDKYKI